MADNLKEKEMLRYVGDNLTIFTIPKPFRGKYGTMQKNAIRSWQAVLRPRDIFLFGTEEDIGKDCERLGCTRKGIWLNKEFGVPRVDTTFERAQRDASTSLMALINTDMIFGPEIRKAIEIVTERFERFLIIGRKTDVDFVELIDFSDKTWWEKLRAFALKNGELHGVCGLDFFFFDRGRYKELPALLIGRKTWDNYLAWYVMQQKIPVVDATKMVMAVHPHTRALRVKSGPAYVYNRKLGGRAGRHGRTNLAAWELTRDGELRERK